MKRSQAIRVLDRIILELSKEIATVHFESFFIINQFKVAIGELRDSLKRAKRIKKNHDIQTPLVGLWTAHYFNDLSDPDFPFFSLGKKSAQENELIQVLVKNMNLQHQWLLVQAYEAFESFYKNLYGALGYLDMSIWRGSDFGNIRIKDAKNKNLFWYKNTAKRTIGKNSIREILNVLRANLEDFESFEKAKKTKTNHKFNIGLVEAFRHIIVHAGGKIETLKLFEAVEQKTGHSLNGNSKSVSDKRTMIASFLETDGDKSIICLTDKKRLLAKNNNAQPSNLFKTLLEYLSNHSALAYSQSIRRFGYEPIWKRDK